MYGSCATQLDLPSSDLDVVIRGLDPRGDNSVHASTSNSVKANKSKGKKPTNQDMGTSKGFASAKEQLHTQSGMQPGPHFPQTQHLNYPNPQNFFPPLSPNANRVMRLAAELEMQPWAVQVKAIPTATVPVIKILADPSRLPGAAAGVANGGDWMMQQQHMAAQAAAAVAGASTATLPSHQVPEPTSSQGEYQSSNPVPDTTQPQASQCHMPPTPPPWRGADVMNGLLSVDITFDGPEHGGIGSTAFSARVVQDACNETGLPPESTAVVQAAMVLKELLAQRRLNEPFSGGLSSYALLLLVVSVMRERKAIREELERVERQRRAVALDECNRVRDVNIASTPIPAPDVCTGYNISDSFKDLNNKPSTLQKKRSNILAKPGLADAKPSLSVYNESVSAKIKKQKEKKNIGENGNMGIQDRKEPLSQSINEATPVPIVSGGSSWASIARTSTAKHSRNQPIESKMLQGKPAPSIKMPSSRNSNSASRNKSKEREATGANKNGNCGPVENVKSSVESKPTHDEKKYCLAQAESKHPSALMNTKKFVAHIKNLDKAIESESSSGTEKDATSIAPLVPSSSYTLGSGRLEGSLLFPQGSNDVLEVLCSGKPSAGKLLMHFLLFYGQHFDAQSTSIDVSGTHHPDCNYFAPSELQDHLSPFISRKAGGTIDPITGVFTVDPIVVYDPLAGCENNNVARSCFAWSSIRWVFSQCYMTLSSVVERGGDDSAISGASASLGTGSRDRSKKGHISGQESMVGRGGLVVNPNSIDDMTPLLELLLSF
jgi:hypothetical protein